MFEVLFLRESWREKRKTCVKCESIARNGIIAVISEQKFGRV